MRVDSQMHPLFKKLVTLNLEKVKIGAYEMKTTNLSKRKRVGESHEAKTVFLCSNAIIFPAT